LYRDALGKYADGIVTDTYWNESVPYKDKFFGTAARFAEYYTNRPEFRLLRDSQSRRSTIR
jgi:branched-chain amino acid transport system substrate-binding protein